MKRLLLAFFLVGCVDGPGIGDELPGDYRAFEEDVQPILNGCANPSCHGTSERPLELYSVRQHRLDPEEIYLETPLSDRELWLNFIRSCGFLMDLEAPEDCELLRKPLSVEAGGVEHGGGVQFGDLENPDYALLLDWVSGESRRQ